MNAIELWAGVECSVVRVGDDYVDQLALTGHDAREDDIDRLAALGVQAVRYPVLWERTAPRGLADADWSFADRRLGALRAYGIPPIVGLVHHGSGPPSTSLLDESFVAGLATFAGAVAERYPWVDAYTPVNEPLTTARFSALYGHWYPHRRDARSFLRALVNQCRATRAAMTAIRAIVPRARLVQTEDLGTVFSTQRVAYQARFENHRRFLSLDLLTGRVDARHPLREWIVGCGIDAAELDDFVARPCPPDVIGLNHYVTSDRFLDHRVERYPERVRGGNGRDAYADVEAARVLGGGIPGHRALLELLWRRYRIPLAITEAHLGCTPEEQIRWLAEAWDGARGARSAGVDVRAVTAWAVFGSSDWDSLLTRPRGHYEPGLFDVRVAPPRPTALARVSVALARGQAPHHELHREPGWWRRDERLAYPPVGRVIPAAATRARPLLVVGAGGTLGRSLVRICRERGLEVAAYARAELDILDRGACRHALERHRPWAVVNAAGWVKVDEAETQVDACVAANAIGALLLTEEAERLGVPCATISSDLVFDGEKGAPYVEDDAPSPLGAYGRSKALAERLVLECSASALVVRTSAFFGWSDASFTAHVLRELAAGRPVITSADVVSPTYVPDLAHALVTLLVDGASGTWHLASAGAMSWHDLACTVAAEAGYDRDLVRLGSDDELGRVAPRPRYSVLASERGALMPPLADALARYAAERGSELVAAAQ